MSGQGGSDRPSLWRWLRCVLAHGGNTSSDWEHSTTASGYTVSTRVRHECGICGRPLGNARREAWDR